MWMKGRMIGCEEGGEGSVRGVNMKGMGKLFRTP